MSKKNIYSEVASPISYTQWAQKCPLNEYRLLTPSEYPPFPGKQQDLLSKAPAAILACSGSGDYVTYIFQMYRHDVHAGVDVIQEHQYVCGYNLKTGESASAFIHEADYGSGGDRTYNVDPSLIHLMTSSNCLPAIFPTQIPPTSGSLDDLRSLGKIAGIDFSYKLGYTQSIIKGVFEP
jgi:hypothetical protein